MDAQTMVRLHTGRPMPVIGLGSWKLSDNTAEAVISALRLGYRMIDTSGDYGTQPGIGEGLKRSGVPRENVYIVSKIEVSDDAYEATKKNLQELQLDYANLTLIHRPPQGSAGEELWRELIRARQDGLTTDIGVSNYSIRQMDALVRATGEMPAVNQIEWTPFGYSSDMFGYCLQNGIIIQAYSPLTRNERLDDEQLVSVADRYGKTPAQILLRWNLQLGTVPLPKANNAAHQKENIAVFDFELSEYDIGLLNSLNEHYSAHGGLPYL